MLIDDKRDPIINDSDAEMKAPVTKPNRPPTSFLLFMEEMREKSVRESGKSFGVSKAASDLWAVLPPEQKQVYIDRANEAKRQYEDAMVAYRSANPDESVVGRAGNRPTIPVGRIKRVMMVDEDVKYVSKDAVVLMAMSTELFLAYLANAVMKRFAGTNRKSIREDDVVQTTMKNDTLKFLYGVFSEEPALAKKRCRKRKPEKLHPHVEAQRPRSYYENLRKDASSGSARGE